MKLADFRKLTASMSGDINLLISAPTANFGMPIKKVTPCTIQPLEATGETFLGFPVVGGDETPALILSA